MDDFDRWKAEYIRGTEAFWNEETIRISTELKKLEKERKAARYLKGTDWFNPINPWNNNEPQ